MYVCIDFDGTIVEHEFPELGDPAPRSFYWMREWQRAGAKLILWTMRSDSRTDHHGPEGHKADRDYLAEAVALCRDNGVEFYAVNGNPNQGSWTSSPKCYAHVYVDDAAFGCPLKDNPGGRPVVDWDVVGPKVLALIRGEP